MKCAGEVHVVVVFRSSQWHGLPTGVGPHAQGHRGHDVYLLVHVSVHEFEHVSVLVSMHAFEHVSMHASVYV